MANKTVDLYERSRGRIRQAFIDAVYQLRGSVKITEFEKLIREGHIEAAVEMLKIDKKFIAGIKEEIAIAYRVHGDLAIKQTHPPRELYEGRAGAFRNPHNNPTAQQYIRDRGVLLLKDIVGPQRELARAVIRQGLQNNLDPKTIATQLCGTWDKKLKRRVNGFLGLTKAQENWITNAHREMSSTSKADLRRYLTRKLRDKRYDSAVRKAIATGKPVPQHLLDNALARYRGRALHYRANTVARTEALIAMSHGRQAALEAMVDQGAVKDAKNITREWISVLGPTTRDDHSAAYGQRTSLHGTFNVGGESCKYPGDSSLSAKQVVNCRCYIRDHVDWNAEESLG